MGEKSQGKFMSLKSVSGYFAIRVCAGLASWVLEFVSSAPLGLWWPWCNGRDKCCPPNLSSIRSRSGCPGHSGQPSAEIPVERDSLKLFSSNACKLCKCVLKTNAMERIHKKYLASSVMTFFKSSISSLTSWSASSNLRFSISPWTRSSSAIWISFSLASSATLASRLSATCQRSHLFTRPGFYDDFLATRST